MKLLREQFDLLEYEVVSNPSGGKEYFIEGIFLQSELKNKNGRVYPMKILEREVDLYTKNLVANKRSYGELNHPDSPSINLDRVSHLVTEIYKKNNDFIAKAKIFNTPCGKIVKCFIDEGSSIGVSSRGVGSLREENGINYVQEDYQLKVAGDIVSEPSAPQAYVAGLMENDEWIFDGSEWVKEFVDKEKQIINKTPTKNLNEAFFKSFNKYIQQL